MERQHLNPAKNSIAPPQTQSHASDRNYTHPIEELQGAIGNRAVNQLLVNQPIVQAKPMFRGLSHELAIQPKLTIGEVGDKYEQEADRISKQVVNQINTPEPRSLAQSQPIQRQETPEADDELQMKPVVQRLASEHGGAIAPNLEASSALAGEGVIQGKGEMRGTSQETSEVLGPNKTGLPDRLKTAIENLSGYSMDDVRVHYNSVKPAQLQAHAYAQGTDIHLTSGQEKHLPHEAWHVVQQKQGRVKPTMQMKEKIRVNDDRGLEKEADVMGAKAISESSKNLDQLNTQRQVNSDLTRPSPFTKTSSTPVQLMLVGCELETRVPIYEKGEREDHVDGYAAQNSDYAHQNVDASLSLPLGKGFEIHIDSSQLARKSALVLLNPNKKIHIAELVAKPVSSRKALLENLKIAKNYLSVFKNYRELTGISYSAGWPIPTENWGVLRSNPIAVEEMEKKSSVEEMEKTFSVEEMEKAFVADRKETIPDLFKVSAQLTFQGSPDTLETISNLDLRSYQSGTKEISRTWRGTTQKIQTKVLENHRIVDINTMAKALNMEKRLGDALVKRSIGVTVKIFKDVLSFLQNERGGTIKNRVPYLIRSDLGCLFEGISSSDRNKFANEIFDAIKLLDIEHIELPDKLRDEIYDSKKKSIILNKISAKDLIEPTGQIIGELEHVNTNLRDKILATKKQIGQLFYWPWAQAMDWLASEVSTAVKHEGKGSEVTGPLHGSQNLSLLPGREPRQELEELNARAKITESWAADPKKFRRKLRPEEMTAAVAIPIESAVVGPAVVFEDRTPLEIDISGDALPEDVVKSLEKVGFPHDSEDLQKCVPWGKTLVPSLESGEFDI